MRPIIIAVLSLAVSGSPLQAADKPARSAVATFAGGRKTGLNRRSSPESTWSVSTFASSMRTVGP